MPCLACGSEFKEEKLEHSEENKKDVVTLSLSEEDRTKPNGADGVMGPKGWLNMRDGDVWFLPGQEGRTLSAAKARLLGQVGVTGHTLERPKGDV